MGTRTEGGQNWSPYVFKVVLSSGWLRLDLRSDAAITDTAGNDLSGLPYEDGDSYVVLHYRAFFPAVSR